MRRQGVQQGRHEDGLQASSVLTRKLYGLKSAGPAATLRRYTKPAGLGVPWYLCRALHAQQDCVRQHLKVAHVETPSLRQIASANVHTSKCLHATPREQPSADAAHGLIAA